MSASFHMAQRTGVILSGDYSAPQLGPEITKWPVGTFGIRDDGSVVKKSGDGYEIWEYPGHSGTSVSDVDGLIVGYRSDLRTAKVDAKKYVAKNASGAGFALAVKPGTWNDGAYTYVVKSATEVYVPETGKTFTSSSDTWGKFVTALNSTKLKTGKAPAKSSGGGTALAPVNSPALVETSTPFYKAKWFLPVVGVSTVGIVLAVALWPSSKKAEVAV
jgi:hypothetical protein